MKTLTAVLILATSLSSFGASYINLDSLTEKIDKCKTSKTEYAFEKKDLDHKGFEVTYKDYELLAGNSKQAGQPDPLALEIEKKMMEIKIVITQAQ